MKLGRFIKLLPITISKGDRSIICGDFNKLMGEARVAKSLLLSLQAIGNLL